MTRSSKSPVLLVAGFVLLLLVVASIGSQLGVGSDSDLSCLVEDSRSGGGAGIQVWAQRMGFQTHPLRVPIWEIQGEVPSTGNCLITAGNNRWNKNEDELTPEEWNSIQNWVASGNSLIVITTTPGTLPRQFSEVLTASSDMTRPISIASSPAVTKTQNEDGILVPTWWGGEMEIDLPRYTLQNCPKDDHLAGWPEQTILARRPLGKGNLYLLLDGAAWTNRKFDHADNAAALARVLKDSLSDSGVLMFDEYRHGYGRVESFSSFFLTLPGAVAFLWMTVIWGLFWLLTSMKRLSPVEPYEEEPRRTAVEFIESIAAMNQRARAAPMAVNSVVQRIRYLTHKRGTFTFEVEQALDEATRSVAHLPRPAVPRNEIKTVSALNQLRKSIYGSHRSSRAD